jgi:hypothetical protein
MMATQLWEQKFSKCLQHKTTQHSTASLTVGKHMLMAAEPLTGMLHIIQQQPLGMKAACTVLTLRTWSLSARCHGTSCIRGGGETSPAHTGVVGSIGLGVGNSRAINCKADGDIRSTHVSNTMMAKQLWEQKFSKCWLHSTAMHH